MSQIYLAKQLLIALTLQDCSPSSNPFEIDGLLIILSIQVVSDQKPGAGDFNWVNFNLKAGF